MNSDPSYLAVVPAYNESATIVGVIESLRERAPGFDVLVVDDGSTDDTAAMAELAGARVLQLPFNLGIGGAVQAGFVFAHDQPLRLHGSGRRRRPARAGRAAQAGRRDGAPAAADMVCGSRFLSDDHHYPAPISRRTGIHIFAACCRGSSSQPCQRSDIRLPPLQPPRDRAVRARLSARLPRGRGGADAPSPPAAHARGAREDVHARRRRVVDQQREVGLLHGQGAARAARRPGPPARRSSIRATRRPSAPSRASDGRPHPARRRSSPRGAAVRGAGDGPAPAADGALRAAVAALARSCSSGWRAGATGLSTSATRSASIYPPNALFVIALGFVLLLLLHFSAAVSRLSDQTKVLAQRLALLEERVDPGGERPGALPTRTNRGSSPIRARRRRFARVSSD